MPLRRPAGRRALGAALTALVAVLWFLFLAPVQVGGPLTFALVDGESMEPAYSTGDLVVARSQPSYDVGDRTVFRYSGGLVVHDLVAGDAQAGWTTQGINKPGVDGWVIPDDDVLGTAWLHVPGAERWISWVFTPYGFGLCAALAALVLMVPTGRRPVRRRSPLLEELPAMRAAHAASATRPWRPAVPTPVEPGLLTACTGLASVSVLAAGLSLQALAADRPLVLVGDVVAPSVVLVLAATVGLLAALAGALLAGRVHRAWGGSPLDCAAARLRSRLVPVLSLPDDLQVVGMPGPEPLLRRAREERVPVLHLVGDDGSHRFVVPGLGAAYELRFDGPSVDLSPQPTAGQDAPRVVVPEQAAATPPHVVVLPDVEPAPPREPGELVSLPERSAVTDLSERADEPVGVLR